MLCSAPAQHSWRILDLLALLVQRHNLDLLAFLVLQHNIHGEYVVPCRGWELPDRLVAYANALLKSTAVDLPAGLRLEPWSTRQQVAPTQV